MYPSAEAAQAAAAELAELDGGARGSYRCGRSREGRPGHYHLTRDRLAEQRGPRALAGAVRRSRHGLYRLADVIPAAAWESLESLRGQVNATT